MCTHRNLTIDLEHDTVCLDCGAVRFPYYEIEGAEVILKAQWYQLTAEEKAHEFL
jgi:hypothetical protein